MHERYYFIIGKIKAAREIGNQNVLKLWKRKLDIWQLRGLSGSLTSIVEILPPLRWRDERQLVGIGNFVWYN